MIYTFALFLDLYVRGDDDNGWAVTFSAYDTRNEQEQVAKRGLAEPWWEYEAEGDSYAAARSILFHCIGHDSGFQHKVLLACSQAGLIGKNGYISPFSERGGTSDMGLSTS